MSLREVPTMNDRRPEGPDLAARLAEAYEREQEAARRREEAAAAPRSSADLATGVGSARKPRRPTRKGAPRAGTGTGRGAATGGDAPAGGQAEEADQRVVLERLERRLRDLEGLPGRLEALEQQVARLVRAVEGRTTAPPRPARPGWGRRLARALLGPRR